jgi:pilus assembly protein CpaE
VWLTCAIPKHWSAIAWRSVTGITTLLFVHCVPRRHGCARHAACSHCVLSQEPATMRQAISVAATSVVLLTADAGLEQAVRIAFAAGGDRSPIRLSVVAGAITEAAALRRLADAAVAVIDVDATDPAQLDALEQLMEQAGGPVIVVTPEMDAVALRRLLRLQVADVLQKPVGADEIRAACLRIARRAGAAERREAQIITVMPSVGGAGATTVAIQAALALQARGRKGATCLVDLDLDHGACADYLDINPRLDLREIEPRPERLDAKLLEVMLSHHASGLTVLAAPGRPAGQRSINPLVITRLLDLIAAHFDHVVIDLPRAWSDWSEDVLRGSDRVIIVSDMTVPSLRRARELAIAAAPCRDGATPPEVVVNRHVRRLFTTGLRLADLKRALGPSFAGTIPCNPAVAREAVDRGVPLEEVRRGNNIAVAIRVLLAARSAQPDAPGRVLRSWLGRLRRARRPKLVAQPLAAG